MSKKKILSLLILSVFLIVGLAATGNKLSSKQKPASKNASQAPSQANELPSATDFTVLNTSGNSVNLSDYYGKPIIINFWASWCPPCKAELPDFEQAYNTYNKDINFLMVNLTDGERETVKTVNQFISKNNYTFPVFYDAASDAARKYKIFSIPTTIFVTKEGNIYETKIGLLNESYLNKKIEELLSL